MAEKNKKDLNHEMFTNKDGYVEGGIEVEMTDPSEMQEQEVQGQGNQSYHHHYLQAQALLEIQHPNKSQTLNFD